MNEAASSVCYNVCCTVIIICLAVFILFGVTFIVKALQFALLFCSFSSNCCIETNATNHIVHLMSQRCVNDAIITACDIFGQ